MAKKDKKRKEKAEEIYCMLLDSASAMRGRGLLKSAPDDPGIQVTMISGDPSVLNESDILQVVPAVRNLPPQIGKLVLVRGDELTLEPLRGAGAAMRKNFRMPMDFESFLYHKAGGRDVIRALNLSCGGVAMYSPALLDVGEVCELVVPVTLDGPLILDCEILRRQTYQGPLQLYAAKFVDLIHDQEAMLREAVFQSQLDSLTAKGPSR